MITESINSITSTKPFIHTDGPPPNIPLIAYAKYVHSQYAERLIIDGKKIYITDIKTKNIIFSDKSIGNIELIDNKTKLKYTKETYLTNNSELSKELFFIIDNKNTLYLDNDYLFKYINTDIILQSNSN